MRRADRLFRIVQLLRARRFSTAESIAEELGTSKRTVYRDVRDLVRSGVPIKSEAGVGYQLEGGLELPPLTFNAEEIAALVLGSRMVEAWGDPELAEAAVSALGKVEAHLPEPLRRVLVDTALFAPSTGLAASRATGMSVLRRAIDKHRKVHFRYVKEDDSETTRTVRPLGLYFFGSKWLVGAWCEMRQDFRTFRQDRMRDIVTLPDRFFPERDGIDLDGFLRHVMGRGARPGAE